MRGVSRHGRRAGGTGPAAVVALATVAVLVVVLAALWLLQDGAQDAREDARARSAGLGAGLLADRVGAAVTDVRSRMAAVADRQGLADAMAERATDAMADAAGQIASAFPAARRVALVPAGFDQVALDAEPPIGYALLAMLRAAEETGAAAGPEAHLLGEPDAHVNLVQPVLRDGDVIGHLLVALPPDWALAERTATAGALGRVELLQDGSALVGHGRGGVPALAHAESVRGTPWQIRVEPAAAAADSGGVLNPRFVTVAGVVAALVILIMALAGRTLARQSAPAVTGDAGGADGPVSGSAEAFRDDAPPPPGPGDGIRVEALADAGDGVALPAHQEASEPAPGAVDNEKEQGVDVDPNLFRAYDIRGVVERSLTPAVVREIGRSIGSEAAARGCTEVVVGRDGRLSSPALSEALIDGLCATGRHVIDIGEVPTPVMYFATHHLGTGTGVAITGSHNPPDYNGMKIMIAGETLSGDAITGLYRRLQADDLIEGEGRVRRQEIAEDYIDAIASDITLHRPLRVVLDAGNGVGGGLGPRVLQAIGCEVECLYCDVDGTFPNHHPDPSDPDNLEALIRLVRLQEADVGLALDGDGDRLGVVDASGKIIWADRQMMLYARDVLARHPGADIVFDVKCSSQLAQVISDNAGVPVMWRTGHSLIKGRLKESGAPLAGEMSGHIFFNDRWPGFDDGIYTAARLLEILSMEPDSSTAVFAALPEAVSTPEIKVHLEEGEPPAVIERLVAAADFPDARVTTIDGLRVDFPDGWGLVRSSNTTPCLVLRFEGDDEQALERIRALFRGLIEQARPGLELPF